MSMEPKTTLVQIRMSEEQKEDLRELAKEYRLDVSELIRKLVEFAKEERPNLLRPLEAPVPEIAGARTLM
jgi:antitoxin component of RelBE/YafQ-DinJ toxin-antitoxin module